MLQSLRNFLSASAAPLRASPCSASKDTSVPVSTSATAAPPDLRGLTPAELDALPAPDSFTQFVVLGFPSCPWFQRAACIVADLNLTSDEVVPVVRQSDRVTYARQLDAIKELHPEASGHNSCPAVLAHICKRDPSTGRTAGTAEYECDQKGRFVGGYSELETALRLTYGFTSKRCNDTFGPIGGNRGCPVPHANTK